MNTQYDSRIVTYFGDPVLRAGFMPVPHLLMRHYSSLGIQTEHAMFAMQLMEITWDLGQPPNTMKKLAERMGVSLRTAQRYSEYLAERGLLLIYEQFEDGAQIENGYDLSPLFERLAELAPEPPLSGAPRERRLRTAPADPDAQQTLSLPPGMPTARTASGRDRDIMPPVTPVARPPVTPVILPPVKNVMGEYDTEDIPDHVAAVAGPATRAAGVNRNRKNLLKNPEEPFHKNIMHDARRSSRTGEQATGYSLRRRRGLTEQEIRATDEACAKMGIDRPMRRILAPALAPGEAWALWLYGQLRGWSTSLIIAQAYDKQHKCAIAAPDLPTTYDAAGDLLAMLDPATALQLIAIIRANCPAHPEVVRNHPLLANEDGQPGQVAAAIWNLAADVRGVEPAALFLPKSAADQDRANDDLATTWRLVLDRLDGVVPPQEFATWLATTRLLQLGADRAIVGTPNVFAREAVETRYGLQLATALGAVVDRGVHVQVVIAAQ